MCPPLFLHGCPRWVCVFSDASKLWRHQLCNACCGPTQLARFLVGAEQSGSWSDRPTLVSKSDEHRLGKLSCFQNTQVFSKSIGFVSRQSGKHFQFQFSGALAPRHPRNFQGVPAPVSQTPGCGGCRSLKQYPGDAWGNNPEPESPTVGVRPRPIKPNCFCACIGQPISLGAWRSAGC